MQRRSFLKAMSASTAGAWLGTDYWCTVEAALAADADKPLPRRVYRDDAKLSIVGFGGIVVIGQTQQDANREVARAVDCGINYFDVAPGYGGGEAEEKLGIALEPYRHKSFLACKTMRRDAAGAQKELDNSLKVLKTDHFDLSEDVTSALPPGDETVYRIAETLGAQFTPLRPDERESLLASSKDMTLIFGS